MSFVIRTVSRTADGREIVRPVTLEKDDLAIGRDASNDIHLADLAVEPFHARLIRTPTGRVRVESKGGLGFTVDGRTTKLADIDPHIGAEVRFGGHLLTISSHGDTVIVRTERTSAVSDAAGDKDERTAFTLAQLLPSKRTGAWTFAVLVLGAFLIAPLWTWASYSHVKTRPVGFHADTVWSSGPLSKAHHALEGNCQACHDKPFTSVEDTRCAACHTDIHGHADPRRLAAAMASPGFGKSIGNAFKVAFGKPTGQRCVDCHIEHRGAGPMPATGQAFCTDCHATLRSRLVDTNIGNVADFGTIHPQFRPAVVLTTAGEKPQLQRVSLDARPFENNGLKFPHDVHLSKTNGVARMAQTMLPVFGQRQQGGGLVCKDCHVSTADGVRFLPVDMERNCQMCHSLAYDRVGATVRTLKHGSVAQAIADVRALGLRPAQAQSMLAGRRRPGETPPTSHGVSAASPDTLFTKGGACFDCHVIERTGNSSTNGWRVRSVVQPMRYLMKGWFDHKAHSTEGCDVCHNATASKSAGDVLIPGIGRAGDKGGITCRSCHGGERSASKVPSSCAMCHDYHLDGQAPWRPTGGGKHDDGNAGLRKP